MKQSSIHSNPSSDVGTTSFQTRKLFWHHPTKDVEHVPWHARPMFFLSPFINALNCCVFNFLSLSLQRLMSYQNIKSLLEIYRWNDWQIAAKFDNVSEGIFCYLSQSYWMGGLRINVCFEDKKNVMKRTIFIFFKQVDERWNNFSVIIYLNYQIQIYLYLPGILQHTVPVYIARSQINFFFHVKLLGQKNSKEQCTLYHVKLEW